MRYAYIVVKKIQVIPLRLPQFLVVHNFSSHFCIKLLKVLRNTQCRTPRVDRRTVVCLFAPPGFSRCGIRPLIGQHTSDSLQYSVSWVAASNQIHRMMIRPALFSVSREKSTGAAHALKTTDAAYAD